MVVTKSGFAGRRRQEDRPSAEPVAFMVAGLLVLSGLVHLAILLATRSSWTGPLSWRKPATFGISFGLMLAGLTWVMSTVQIPPRTRARVLVALMVACVLEVSVITVQKWRGQPSHFGVTGAGAPLVAAAAVGGFALLIVAGTIAAIHVLRAPGSDPSFRLALRVGFAWLLVSVGLGTYMLARGQVISRVHQDVSGAFAFTATLKLAHEATFVGILILPVVARMLNKTRRSQASRLRTVAVICVGYSVLNCALVVVGLVRSTAHAS